MAVRYWMLILSVVSIASAASSPTAVLHEAFPSHSKATESSPNIIPDREYIEHRSASLGVMQEAARTMLPPPIWNVLEDLPDILFNSYDDPKTKPQSQVKSQLNLNWLELLAPYYLPNLKNVSPECRRDVNAISMGIIEQKEWALKVVDSWGKFPDGMMAGNTMTFGLFDECLMTSVDSKEPDAHFNGQYCAFSVVMHNNTMEGEKEEGENEVQGADMALHKLRMANMKGILQMAIPYNLMSTCIPSTCTKEEYKHSLEDHLEQRGLMLVVLECQTKDMPSMRYNTADIIMIITLTILGFLVLVGTCIDVSITVRKQDASQCSMRYFLVFSLYTNVPKIFHINVNERKDVISCLHGIRVLSMCWVVLGHAFLLSILPSANRALLQQMVKEHPYFYQLILNAYPSVDTFFFMSGLLVAYNLTKEYQRTSKFNVPLYYIHRFIRLAPPILLLCGFCAVFPPLFVKGSISPMMVEKANLVDNCIRYWWRDSFFISNVFIGQKDGMTCLPVCWFTAVDFQLYIVTPLMFLPVLYYRRPGVLVFASFVLVSVVIPMAIIGSFQLPPTNVTDVTMLDMQDSMLYVYVKPWCRATPYLLGLGLGYFLRVVDRDKVQLRWWQAMLGWIVAVATMSAVVFGLHEYNTLSQKPHEYDPAVSILYGGFHRLAWGAAVAWMVFACHMGYGGPINSVLAHPLWQPLSRLTYAIFLIAFNVQSLYYNYYVRLPAYFTPFYKVMETIGVLFISMLGGLVLSLLAESPVLGLEKLLLRKPSPNSMPITATQNSTSCNATDTSTANSSMTQGSESTITFDAEQNDLMKTKDSNK